ncbi:hypothetical protein LJB42_003766 [Komagataella kurtzmanii]|nr:hypothetical protein LJB42_003766 [Komagataella kurtzmanii]
MLPFSYDVSSKKLKVTGDYADLEYDIQQLNTLSGEILVNKADVPSPPSKESFDKKLSHMAQKLHESAVSNIKTGKYPEAIKLLTTGLEMVNRRPKYESFQMTLSEMTIFIVTRADAYMMNGDFEGAFNDADLLVTLLPSIPDNYIRRGVALFKMGRYVDAKNNFERGLSFDSDNAKLKKELDFVLKKIDEENGEL